METKETISIAKDFSNRLGARYRKDGPYSGQEFLESHLKPAFERAVAGDYRVLIDPLNLIKFLTISLQLKFYKQYYFLSQTKFTNN